ncbi:YheC/YheD family protein [Paenibacillus sp. D51F]
MPYWNNKYGKHRIMMKKEELAKHLPPTAIATKESVRRMAKRHGSVYLKPILGTGGFGIFKLSTENGKFRLQNGTRSRLFGQYEKAYAAFASASQKKRYLAQKSIPLLRVEGRPFDLRIMVQRNPRHEWEVTGTVARLALPRKIVTNYHSGGKPMPLWNLLGTQVPKADRPAYEKRLKQLALKASSHIGTYFPRFRAYGVDVGIDKELRPWIIEVNSKPDKSIFNALSDKRMYRKILRYGRLAGTSRKQRFTVKK